jgi:hypothetical protein
MKRILPLGLRPYVTVARQVTLTTGEGGQVEPGLVDSRTFVAPSKLNEYGVKGSFLDGQLHPWPQGRRPRSSDNRRVAAVAAGESAARSRPGAGGGALKRAGARTAGERCRAGGMGRARSAEMTGARAARLHRGHVRNKYAASCEPMPLATNDSF